MSADQSSESIVVDTERRPTIDRIIMIHCIRAIILLSCDNVGYITLIWLLFLMNKCNLIIFPLSASAFSTYLQIKHLINSPTVLYCTPMVFVLDLIHNNLLTYLGLLTYWLGHGYQNYRSTPGDCQCHHSSFIIMCFALTHETPPAVQTIVF